MKVDILIRLKKYWSLLYRPKTRRIGTKKHACCPWPGIRSFSETSYHDLRGECSNKVCQSLFLTVTSRTQPNQVSISSKVLFCIQDRSLFSASGVPFRSWWDRRFLYRVFLLPDACVPEERFRSRGPQTCKITGPHASVDARHADVTGCLSFAGAEMTLALLPAAVCYQGFLTIFYWVRDKYKYSEISAGFFVLLFVGFHHCPVFIMTDHQEFINPDLCPCSKIFYSRLELFFKLTAPLPMRKKFGFIGLE